MNVNRILRIVFSIGVGGFVTGIVISSLRKKENTAFDPSITKNVEKSLEVDCEVPSSEADALLVDTDLKTVPDDEHRVLLSEKNIRQILNENNDRHFATRIPDSDPPRFRYYQIKYGKVWYAITEAGPYESIEDYGNGDWIQTHYSDLIIHSENYKENLSNRFLVRFRDDHGHIIDYNSFASEKDALSAGEELIQSSGEIWPYPAEHLDQFGHKTIQVTFQIIDQLQTSNTYRKA